MGPGPLPGLLLPEVFLLYVFFSLVQRISRSWKDGKSLLLASNSRSTERNRPESLLAVAAVDRTQIPGPDSYPAAVGQGEGPRWR